MNLSIPALLQAMHGYATHHGWHVFPDYIEPGVSAKTAERPELQKLLTYLRDTRESVDDVVVQQSVRLNGVRESLYHTLEYL